jgi:hypothetical protein
MRPRRYPSGNFPLHHEGAGFYVISVEQRFFDEQGADGVGEVSCDMQRKTGHGKIELKRIAPVQRPLARSEPGLQFRDNIRVKFHAVEVRKAHLERNTERAFPRAYFKHPLPGKDIDCAGDFKCIGRGSQEMLSEAFFGSHLPAFTKNNRLNIFQIQQGISTYNLSILLPARP